MKTTYLAMFAAASMISVSNGALYTVTTNNTADSPGIGDSRAIPFQNSTNASLAGRGTVAIGFFSGLTDDQIASALSPTTLTSAFQTFGIGGAFTAPGFTGTRGTFSRAETAPVTGTPFANQSMYVFVGNGTSFGASTEFLVLKTEFTFNPAQDSVSTPETLTITRQNTSILIGNPAADIRTTTADATVTPGWTTAVLIPEPSTALLGLVGALGLLRRRR